MDAVEFIKTCARICRKYGDCKDCILSDFCDHSCYEYDNYQVAEQAVANVLEWAKEHPVKTRQSEFLKQWPDAEIGDDGYPSVAPCQLYKDMEEKDENGVCCKNCGCGVCRRDFWLKEIE